MRRSQGMTLIEVLAATVLLAMIVAVCLPMLIGKARSDATQTDITLEELALIADRALSDPAAYGLGPANGTVLINGPRLQVISPSTPADIHLCVLHPTSPETGHVWVVFLSGATSVSRWLSIESIGVAP